MASTESGLAAINTEGGQCRHVEDSESVVPKALRTAPLRLMNLPAQSTWVSQVSFGHFTADQTLFV